MSFERARAYLELLRPLNVLIIMAVIASASVLAGGGSESVIRIAIAALVGGFVGGAANVINDYFDIAIDKINKPHRPLPREAVSKNEALILWLVLSAVGISLNLFLNSAALGIAVVAVLFLLLYSAKLKGTVLVGNVTVAAMTGLAFVYGAVVIGRPEASWIPAAFAFLLNLAREIVKDVEDMEGDRRGHAVTFPLRHGVKPALAAASFTLVVLIGATFWPYLAGIYSRTYLLIVLVADFILLCVLILLWRDSSPARMGRLSFALKLNMLLGLVAIYCGT